MSAVVALSGLGVVSMLCGAGWVMWGIYTLPIKTRRLYNRMLVGFLHVATGATAILFPAKLHTLFTGYRQSVGLAEATQRMGAHLLPYSVACFLVVCAGMMLLAAWPLGWRGPYGAERLSGVSVIAIGLGMYLYSSQWGLGSVVSIVGLASALVLLALIAGLFSLADVGSGRTAFRPTVQ